jgi:hypothetical protein
MYWLPGLESNQRAAGGAMMGSGGFNETSGLKREHKLAD